MATGRYRMPWWMALASCLLPCPAGAHEFWLAPTRYRAARGDTVAVKAYVGTGFRGEIKPYAPSRAVRFSLRTTRDIDLSRAARNGDLVMARFVVADEGGSLVSHQSTFADVELPAAEFDAYLKLEGLDAVRARRAHASSSGVVRERYARCAKTWVAGSEVTRITRPTGLTYELTPLATPASGSLTVRATFRGRPLSGALVRAWNRPLPKGGRPFDPTMRDSVPSWTEGRTDARGLVTLPLGRTGEWLFSSVHMVPSADREEADWESYWASLTFARSAP